MLSGCFRVHPPHGCEWVAVEMDVSCVGRNGVVRPVDFVGEKIAEDSKSYRQWGLVRVDSARKFTWPPVHQVFIPWVFRRVHSVEADTALASLKCKTPETGSRPSFYQKKKKKKKGVLQTARCMWVCVFGSA